MRLIRIPLVLLVPESAPWRSAEELLARRKIPEPLVAQPAETSFMLDFQRELKRRRVTWPQAIEATSVELVMRYVLNGEGYGIANRAAVATLPTAGIRALPLEGFEPLTVGVLWRGELTGLLRMMIHEIRSYAHRTFAGWEVPDDLD